MARSKLADLELQGFRRMHIQFADDCEMTDHCIATGSSRRGNLRLALSWGHGYRRRLFEMTFALPRTTVVLFFLSSASSAFLNLFP